MKSYEGKNLVCVCPSPTNFHVQEILVSYKKENKQWPFNIKAAFSGLKGTKSPG